MLSAEVFSRDGVVYAARPHYRLDDTAVIEYWLIDAYPDHGLGLFRVEVPAGVGEETRHRTIADEYRRLVSARGAAVTR